MVRRRSCPSSDPCVNESASKTHFPNAVGAANTRKQTQEAKEARELLLPRASTLQSLFDRMTKSRSLSRRCPILASLDWEFFFALPKKNRLLSPKRKATAPKRRKEFVLFSIGRVTFAEDAETERGLNSGSCDNGCSWAENQTIPQKNNTPPLNVECGCGGEGTRDEGNAGRELLKE